MANSHKGSKLLLANTIIPVNEYTTALWHYDITENEVLYGIEPLNNVSTLRRREGKYGGGIAIEEATSNLIKTVSGGDSFFDTAQGWSLRNDATAVVTIVSDRGSLYGNGNVLRYEDKDGNTSGNVWDGAALNSRVTGLASGNQHAFSLRYKVEGYTTGQVAVWSHWQDTTAVNGSQPADYVLDASTFNKGWQIATFVSTCPTGYNAKTFSPGMNLTNARCTLYIDAIQFEPKSFSTSFVNGSRAAGILSYPADCINPAQGTISFWYLPSYPSSAVTSQNNSPKMIQVGGYYANSSFTIWNITNSFNVYVKGATNTGWSGSTSAGNVFSQNIWSMISVTWNGTAWKVYRNGMLASSFTASESLGAINGNTLYVGGDGNGAGGNGQVCNGIIDELRIDRIERTAEEITSWYLSQNPFYPKGVYRIAY